MATNPRTDKFPASGVEADPIATEVIRNAFNSIADDMSAVLSRSAYSMIIYECHDFGIALFDDHARLLGQYAGLPLFVGGLDSGLIEVLRKYGVDDLRDGDIFTINDSYITGGHLNDVDVIGVIRHKGELVGFSAVRAHWLDIGTASAGFPVNTTDIYQEGLRWGATLIMRDGEWIQDVLDILLLNSRTRRALQGDLSAMIAAIRMGNRRFKELLDRFGPEVVKSATGHFLELTEKRYRDFIGKIPDGEYFAEGYSDNDGITDDPVEVRVRVQVAGDQITVDTTGSSRQRAGNLNTGLANTVSAVRLALSFLIPDPDPRANHGSFMPLRVVAEPGSIFNATEPAPCMRPHPVMLLIDLIIKALAPVLPTRVAAGLPGDSWNIFIMGEHPDTGEFFMSGEALTGGWGANHAADGESTLIHSAAGDFRNIPTEILESRFPFLVTRCEFGKNSGGAGRLRGGLNLVKEYELLAPARVTLHFDRSRMPQWGLFGGAPGAAPKVTIVPADGSAPYHVNKVEALSMSAGDRIIAETGGGGGYGDPTKRNRDLVRADLERGYITPEHARPVYQYDPSAEPGESTP